MKSIRKTKSRRIKINIIDFKNLKRIHNDNFREKKLSARILKTKTNEMTTNEKTIQRNIRKKMIILKIMKIIIQTMNMIMII